MNHLEHARHSEQRYGQGASFLPPSPYEFATCLFSPSVSYADIEELTQAFDDLTLGSDHFPILTDFGTEGGEGEWWEEEEDKDDSWQYNDVVMEDFDGVAVSERDVGYYYPSTCDGYGYPESVSVGHGYPYDYYDHDHTFGSCASCFGEEDIIE